MGKAYSPQELEQKLRDIGRKKYHNNHPFHQFQYQGKLSKFQMQAWALNRYYYQSNIPIKDALILAKISDPVLHNLWRQRIMDHDGENPTSREGGLKRWLYLATSLGLDRSMVISCQRILPGTRFAVDAYVNFVRQANLLEAIASSLTEMFSPAIINERMSGMLKHYDYINADTLIYFQKRPPQAKRDSVNALNYVLQHARNDHEQESVINALSLKCDILWAQLDAVYFAYIEPGIITPGAYGAEDEGIHEETFKGNCGGKRHVHNC